MDEPNSKLMDEVKELRELATRQAALIRAVNDVPQEIINNMIISELSLELTFLQKLNIQKKVVIDVLKDEYFKKTGQHMPYYLSRLTYFEDTRRSEVVTSQTKQILRSITNKAIDYRNSLLQDIDEINKAALKPPYNPENETADEMEINISKTSSPAPSGSTLVSYDEEATTSKDN